MAKIHVLAVSEMKHEVDLVYHVPVPAETNAAGLALSVAAKQYLGRSGAITSRVPDLAATNAAELTQIENGEVWEHATRMEFDAKLTNLQKAVLIDADYQAKAESITARIRNVLSFWGMTRNPA